ncbi:M28 family peptidase [Brevibacillus centrosporus]|uniref:M28 family peptidase n=1 Tax=Brevibacillus centrosporus TaxID=54910 RepID=UPI002E20BC41|nr:M28 family peptidase [Brevibacillus centrosporus]
MRPLRNYSLTALLAGGLLLLPLPFFTEANAQSVPEWIDADTLYEHVEKLARTPRPPATESEFAAAVYVENQLRAYGYETDLQPFYYYTYRQPPSLTLSVEGWKGSAWDVRSFTYGPNGTGTGELVDSGFGTAADFQDGKARGKIALVKRGQTTFGEKVRQAAAAGAVAVIIWNDREDNRKATLGEPLDMSVPVVSLSKEQGGRLQEALKKGTLKGTVKVDGGLTTRQTSYNIVASRKPGQAGTGQTVLVTAHHDSAAKSPGANNGASGVAALLEVARMLAERSIDTEVRLVSFGSTSTGERGPAAYVESLSDADRRKTIAAFCLDAVGSREAGDLTVTDEQGTKSLPVSLAESSGAVFSTVWNDRGEKTGDHLALTDAGIPSALLTRAPADTWRDQPEDTVEKIDRERLAEAVHVVFSAVTQITDFASPAYRENADGSQSGKSTESEATQ